MKTNYKKAQDKVNKLLKKYQIEEPIVPIFEIAEAEGVNLNFIKMPEKLKDVSGFFNAEKKVIFINEDDSPNRQVFTVAHELAHFILEHKSGEYGVLLRRTQLIQQNPQEREANYFAASILAPYKMLKKAMRQYSLTKFDTKLLAKMFGVSEEVIRYRLQRM